LTNLIAEKVGHVIKLFTNDADRDKYTQLLSQGPILQNFVSAESVFFNFHPKFFRHISTKDNRFSVVREHLKRTQVRVETCCANKVQKIVIGGCVCKNFFNRFKFV
jgi:hypothetical protein